MSAMQSHLSLFQLRHYEASNFNLKTACNYLSGSSAEHAELKQTFLFDKSPDHVVERVLYGPNDVDLYPDLLALAREGANYVFVGPLLGRPIWGSGIVLRDATNLRLVEAA